MNQTDQAVAGIDVGTGGGVSILKQQLLCQVYDMPVLNDGPKGRKTISAALLADILYKEKVTKVYCELVGPRPGEGAVGAFAFGRSLGVVQGVCAAAGIPITMIAPPTWKRHAGIPPGKEHKDRARAIAISHWPSQAGLFARKCDLDRAESALIALCGMAREGGL